MLFKTTILYYIRPLIYRMILFFIIKSPSSNILDRVLVEGILKKPICELDKSIETNSQDIVTQLLSADNKTVRNNYVSKLNKQNIYFKEQFLSIKPHPSNSLHSSKYKVYSDSEFSEIITSVNFFFIEEYYKDLSDREIDSYKVVVTPNTFIEFIDSNIMRALKINKKISDNYSVLSDRDKDLLTEKNSILLNRDIYDFNRIITILKEREKISYLLLDVDVEISNVLINLNNIKFIKVINNDSLVESLYLLKDTIKSIDNLENITKKLI
jgi:hypothetical protein